MAGGGSRVLTGVLVLLAFAAGFAVRGWMADEPIVAPPEPVAPRTATRAAVPAPRRVSASEQPSPPQVPPEGVRPARELFPTSPALPRGLGRIELPGDDVACATVVRIRGRCVDESGAPVRADVRLPGGSAVATNADGTFALNDACSSIREISFSPIACGQAWQRVLLRTAADGVIDQGDVVLRRGATVRGRFTDLDGRPIARSTVLMHIADIGWRTRSALTDDTGAFVFENVGDGFLVVSGRSPGSRVEGADHDAWVHLPQRDGRDVELKTLSAHYVRLGFVDERGAPMPRRSGRWRWFGLDDPSEGEEGSWTDSPPWDHMRVPVRPGATYEFRFECDDCLPVIQRFEGSEESDLRVAVVLHPVAR